MLSGAARRKGQQRFSLLLLDDGDHYITDWVATCHLVDGQPRVLAGGRLRLCMKSLFFEAQDPAVPIFMFPMPHLLLAFHPASNRRYTSQLGARLAAEGRIRGEWAGEGAGGGGEEGSGGNGGDWERGRGRRGDGGVLGNADVVYVTTSMYVKMKAGGQDVPYEFEKKELDEGDLPSTWAFSLDYTSTTRLLDEALPVLGVQLLPYEQRDMEVARRLSLMEASAPFDVSRLVDLSEHILLDCLASQVRPLVREPGRLVLTQQRLYFQPLHAISSESPLRIFPLPLLLSAARRRHSLRPRGLEIFFSCPGQSHHASSAGTGGGGLEGGSGAGGRGGGSMRSGGSGGSGLRGGGGPLGDGSSVFFVFNSEKERDRAADLLLKLLGEPQGPSSPAAVAASLLEAHTHALQAVTGLWQSACGAHLQPRLPALPQFGAGRSECELAQWPVMPWVLADYGSQHLTLDDPTTFRDLSKPVGALNPARLAEFKERYSEMPREEGGSERAKPFLYGTHYSTPGYVLYWLVRSAPAHMLRLQNGRLDSPDRLFTGLQESWESVLGNATDVKELIPHFFSLPAHFLRLPSDLNLGTRQNGVPIGDVELPPWAKDAEDFILKHVQALESEWVSANLHHWIDLIFGYKQRGKAAEEADNVFHPLTYEGAVDLDSLSSFVERRGFETQINEFGQTPRQLFLHPHPQRRPHSSPVLPSPTSHLSSTAVDLLMRLLALLPTAAAAAPAPAPTPATAAAAPAPAPSAAATASGAVAGSGAAARATGATIAAGGTEATDATSGTGGTAAGPATGGADAAGGGSGRTDPVAVTDGMTDAHAVAAAAAAAAGTVSISHSKGRNVESAAFMPAAPQAAGEEPAAPAAPDAAVPGAGVRLEPMEEEASLAAPPAATGPPGPTNSDTTSAERHSAATHSTAEDRGASGGAGAVTGGMGPGREGSMEPEDASGRLKALQGAVGLGSFNARRAGQGRAAARAVGAAVAAVGAGSMPELARGAALREGEEMAALREWLDEAGAGRGGDEEDAACSPPFSPTAPFPAFESSALDLGTGMSTASDGSSETSSSGGGSIGSSRTSNGAGSAVSSRASSKTSSQAGDRSSSEGRSGRRARVRRVKAHRGPVVAVALSEHAESRGMLLTTAGADGMVKVFSVESQQQLRSARVGSLPLASMALLPPPPSHCYPSVLVGSSDDHVWLYSPDFGRCLSKLHAHDDTVSCVQVSQWGGDTCLFTASWDCTVKQWTMSRSPFLSASPFASFSSSSTHSYGGFHTTVHPPPLAELNQHDAPITTLQVAIPATSAWPLAASGSANGSVLLWDMRAPPSASVPWRGLLSPLTGPTTSLAVTGLVFSYGGLHLTAADSTGGLRVLEMRMGGAELASQQCPGGGLTCCQPLGDQSVLAGSDWGHIFAWSWASGLEPPQPLSNGAMQNHGARGYGGCYGILAAQQHTVQSSSKRAEGLSFFSVPVSSSGVSSLVAAQSAKGSRTMVAGCKDGAAALII
ncbi:hypothetical protein CLOM_g2335 [Closterium sp. NIES-68]|nr:hypothetical protein CLOM_g2335 [Closterium sp. NIES-68]